MKSFILRLIIVWGFLFIFTQSSIAAAAKVQDPCRTYETVFSRGSGDGDPQDTTSNSFLQNLQTSLGIDSNTLLHHYDLGEESYNNYKYPHVGVFGGWSNTLNGIGASISNGEGFTYGKSVDTGVGELVAYLQQRMKKCPDAKYIVAGYSQGAQVVSNSVSSMSKLERDKITYVALFGNPKLYLPEAHSYKAYQKDPMPSGTPLPDSCYGTGLSPWHNVIEDCLTFSGRLYSEDSHIPYPSDIQARIHEWCFDEDGICDGEKESWSPGHSKYSEKEGVPRAITEALYASGATPVPSFINLSDSSKRYDILFEIPMQCTPLFRSSERIPTLAIPYKLLDISQQYEQVAIVGESVYDIDYGQYEYTEREYIASLWRENTEHIRYRISPLNCADQYVNQTAMRQTAVDQQEAENLKTSSFRMLSVSDPITDYNNTPIITEIPDDPICLISSNCRIIDATSNVLTQPVPIYPAVKNITNLVNHSVSYSLSQNSPLNMYDTYLWDVDADGYTDITTSTPTLAYAYPNLYTGTLNVIALSSTNGLSASTEFNVTILANYSTPTKPRAPLDLSVKKLPNNSVFVNWNRDPLDTVTAGWLLLVDGFPVGKMRLDATQITVTDMHFEENKPRTISVVGLTNTDLQGSSSSITIQPTLPNNVTVGTDNTLNGHTQQTFSVSVGSAQPTDSHNTLGVSTGLPILDIVPQLSAVADRGQASKANNSWSFVWAIILVTIVATLFLSALGYAKHK